VKGFGDYVLTVERVKTAGNGDFSVVLYCPDGS
jgi:hypothetical protein